MSDGVSTHERDTRTILTERRGTTLLVTINRPEVKNALDAPTALALAQAVGAFDHDEGLAVAVLHGSGGTFCSGFDLKAVADGTRMPQVSEEGDGPLGVTRMLLSKPVIAAVEGYAVADRPSPPSLLHRRTFSGLCLLVPPAATTTATTTTQDELV